MVPSRIVGSVLLLAILAARSRADVIVERVAPDSVAARLGLQAGDRLLTCDGKPLPSPAAFDGSQANRPTLAGGLLTLKRGGAFLTLNLPREAPGLEVRYDLPAAALAPYEEGLAALRAGKPDEAIARWRTAAKTSQDGGHGEAAAWLCRRAAMVHEERRQWKEAREAHTASWELLKASGDLAARSWQCSALSRCCENLSDLPAARQWIEQAVQIATSTPFEDWEVIYVYRLGNISLEQGDLRLAKDYYQRALECQERLRDRYPEGEQSIYDYRVAMSTRGLGLVALKQGDLDTAERLERGALGTFERLAGKDPRTGAPLPSLDVADSLQHLGAIARERGELGREKELLDRCLAMRLKLDPESLLVAQSCNNLGSLARARGDLEGAREYYRRALALYEKLAAGSLGVARALHNLGVVEHDQGRLAPAAEYYRRSLAIKERIAPNSLDAAYSIDSLGCVARDQGNLAEAKALFEQALAMWEKLAPGARDVARGLSHLGGVAQKEGNLAATREYFERALQIEDRLAPEALGTAASLSVLGWVARKQGRLDDALACCRRAVEIVESQRRQIATAEDRALLLARPTGEYAELLRTLIALDDLPAAFATLERSRARSLVELLAERQLDLRADAPAELLKQQAELDTRRSAAYSLLASLGPDAEAARIEDLRSEIAALGRRQRELTAAIQQASPKLAALQYPQPLDLPGARAALDPGTLLLAYYVDEEETYLFAVTPSSQRPASGNGLGLFVVRVTAKELQERVGLFRQAVVEQEAVQQEGKELYDLLVRPAQALINRAQRVLICPDGPLNTLPFAALVADPPAHGFRSGRRRNDVRYLAALKPLHTIVSMTVYAETRKEARPSTRPVTLLAFGDPEYGRARSGETPAPGAASSIPVPPSSTIRNPLSTPPGLSPLPGTRAEVEAISSVYGAEAQRRLGREATETAVKRESGAARYLHFACHGLLDSRDPLGSGLALTTSAGEGGDDGLLQAWEILERLRLQADLVVLSACETGLGQTTKNEGVVGLTRAFLYAGSKSVAVSLWSVADESTAALMTALYRELKRGRTKDAALQRAMAAVRRDRRWRHPFYWAPFTLTGNWR